MFAGQDESLWLKYGIPAAISVIVTVIMTNLLPWYKKSGTTRKIKLEYSGIHGDGHNDHLNVRVTNTGIHTIIQACLYITIQHDQNDICASPAVEVETFHTPQAPAKLDDVPLCWASQITGAITPAKVDIYSKEGQVFSPFLLRRDDMLIEVPSEAGWSFDRPSGSDKNRNVRVSRAFLKWKKYTGTLKIVSAESIGRIYSFRLDPDNRITPLVIEPIPHRGLFPI